MINVQNENKVYTIDEKDLKSYELRGYKKVEAEQAQEKTFEQMNAGEQIVFVGTVETIEALEALKDKTDKATAVKAIENKIIVLKADADTKAKAEAEKAFEALKIEAEGLEGVEILPEDTLETLQAKVDAKKNEGKQPE